VKHKIGEAIILRIVMGRLIMFFSLFVVTFRPALLRVYQLSWTWTQLQIFI